MPSLSSSRYPPAVLGDNRTVGPGIFERLNVLVGGFGPLAVPHDLTGHDLHAALIAPAAGNAADAPSVVVHGGDHTGHMRPVIGIALRAVLLLGGRLPVEHRGVVPEIEAVFLRIFRIAPDVGLQVGVVGLHGLVDHRHDNILTAGAELPSIEQIDVGTRLRLIEMPIRARIVVMPLILQQRIVHRRRGTCSAHFAEIVPGSRNGRADAHRANVSRIDLVLHDSDAGQRGKTAADLSEIDAFVERNAVPTVHAGFVVNLLPIGIVGDDALETPGADLIQQLVDRADSRSRHGSAAGGGQLRLRNRDSLRHFGRELYGDLPFQGEFGGRSPDDPGRVRAGAVGEFRRFFRTCKRRKQTSDE